MRHFLTAVRVLYREIEGRRVDRLGIHTPALGRVGKGLLQLHELREVVVIERIGLAQIATGIQLVEPHPPRRGTFLEEEHHGLYTRTLKRAAGTVEHRVEVAAFQPQFPQIHRGVVGVGKERILDDHAAAPARLDDFDEVLENQERGLAGADGEVLLHLGAFLASEGRIGQHHVVAVLFLNVREILGQRVSVDDVRRFDPVQDHVHDADDVGEGLLFLAVEGAFLKGAVLRGGALGVRLPEVVEGFAEEAHRAAGTVINAFAQLRRDDLDDRALQRARVVILSAVAPGVAHVLDLGFVKVGEFVLLDLRAEAEFVDVVDDLAQVVAALDAVLYFAEDFADFVFDRVRPGGALLEARQIGEELGVDELGEVVAGEGGVVVDLAVLAFGRRPAFPAILPFEDEAVFFPFQLRLHGFVVLQRVEVFQEQEPGTLLGVIQITGAAGVLPEDVVDVFEGLFEHALVGVFSGGVVPIVGGTESPLGNRLPMRRQPELPVPMPRVTPGRVVRSEGRIRSVGR